MQFDHSNTDALQSGRKIEACKMDLTFEVSR